MKLLTMTDAEYERLEQYEIDASGPLFAEIAARGELVDELLGVLGRLVDGLPKCDECGSPATRAFVRGGGRWCDEHGLSQIRAEGERPREVPEYRDRAAPLREAIAAGGLVGFYDSRARRRKRVHLPIAGPHERPDLCTPCGGKCCETFPGVPHPNDLGAPDEDLLRANVAALLATGANRWCQTRPSLA